MWFAVSGQRIIGPVIFYDMVYSVNNILETFLQTLTEEEKQRAYFQQDNATTRTSQHSVEAFLETFGEKIIGWGPWLPYSPDLSVCDFYL